MKRSLGMVVWVVGLAVTVGSSDPWASAVARDRRREADRHTPDREKGQHARVPRADARAVSRDRAVQGDDPHQQPRGVVEPGVPAERKHHLHRAPPWPDADTPHRRHRVGAVGRRVGRLVARRERHRPARCRARSRLREQQAGVLQLLQLHRQHEHEHVHRSRASRRKRAGADRRHRHFPRRCRSCRRSVSAQRRAAAS